MDNYETVIRARIRLSIMTTCTKSFEYRLLAVGSPPKLDNSRTLIDHHIQRLGFKTKVSEALIGVEIFDGLSRKSNLQFTMVLELSMSIEASPIKFEVEE